MTYRKKNIILLISLITLLFISFRFPIARTIELKEKINQLEKNLNDSIISSSSINRYKKRSIFVDSILSSSLSETKTSQNYLLNLLNSIRDTSNISITQFNKPHTVKTLNNIESTHFIFTIKGTYSDLEKTLYEIERKKNIGTITSVSFKKNKDFKTRKKYLTCTVFLKQYTPL